MDSIHIQIPSIIENIRIIESFIDNVKEAYQISDDIYGNIMVAVTEAVNNAIVHGNKQDRSKNVDLSLHFHEDMIRFVVEDEGEGFDYHHLPDPTDPENLHKPHGRGIYLIKQLCDEVKFKNNGKCIELIFYINGQY
jgi:serine/threonine-protein kinase RsbW